MSSITQTPGTTLRLKYRDATGADRDLPFPLDILTRSPTSRKPIGRLFFLENFRGPIPSIYNDGAGSGSRDSEVSFNGHPSYRLDTQSVQAAGSDPGSGGPIANSVIVKRRFQGAVGGGKWAGEWWIYFSHSLSDSASLTSVSLYRRDGTDFFGGRLWLDTTTTPMSLKILNSSGTWDQKETYNFVQGHQYQMSIGQQDRAGEWHYVRLAVDFTKNEYLYFQFNETLKDLAGVAIRKFADATTARDIHFSIEFAAIEAQRKHIHLGELSGYTED